MLYPIELGVQIAISAALLTQLVRFAKWHVTPEMTPNPRNWVANPHSESVRLIPSASIPKKLAWRNPRNRTPASLSSRTLHDGGPRRSGASCATLVPGTILTGPLQKCLDQKDDLHAGRTPLVSVEGLTVRDLLNRFLTAKRSLVDTREIAQRTFLDYYAICKRIGDAFGLDRLVDDLASDDFEHLRKELAKTRGPVALGNKIQRVRTVFKHAYDAGLVDKPVWYGPTFKRPSRRVLRKQRYSNGPRMLEAEEIRAMIDVAGVQLRTMILLGINCGFGNSDVANLSKKALDLKGGWIDYARPKTGILRRCPLWPETIEALREVIAARPKPKDNANAGLVFIARYGKRWGKDIADNPISKEVAKLLETLGIRRKGVGFYALRHTFETIGGDSRDQVAVDHIMGHARDDMASVYRERIGDERLRAVTDHIHRWLFGDA